MTPAFATRGTSLCELIEGAEATLALPRQLRSCSRARDAVSGVYPVRIGAVAFMLTPTKHIRLLLGYFMGVLASASSSAGSWCSF